MRSKQQIISQNTSSSSSSSIINPVAFTALQQFEDRIKQQCFNLSTLPDGLEEERYKIIYPPLEREQRYIM